MNSRYGEENLRIYATYFKPLEWNYAEHSSDSCYIKLICYEPVDEKVVGFHYVGPNAGEVTQGYSVAMKLGAKK